MIKQAFVIGMVSWVAVAAGAPTSTAIPAWPDAAERDGIVSGLIPQPRELAPVEDDFLLTADTVLVRSEQATADERFAFKDFNDFLKENGRSPLRIMTPTEADKVGIGSRLRVGLEPRDGFVAKALTAGGLSPSENIGQEGYQLRVDEGGVVIGARTPAGAFYGLQTLKQLFYQNGDKTLIRGVTVTDAPHYRLRGFQFDAGRAPHSLPAMRRIVRICSRFKLNFVVFREGDDELNAIRYRGNKLGSRNPEAISVDEMAQFVAYAARYHIAIVPEVESLGHCAAKGFVYPELIDDHGPKTKYPGIGIHHRKRRLILSKPESYELLRSIYAEWLPMMTSPYIHLGCDEAGGGSSEHLGKLYAMLEELGRAGGRRVQPIVWADAAPTPESLKGKFIRCLWCYGGGGDPTLDNRYLVKQGIRELSEPGCPEPVLMAGGSDSYHTPLSKLEYPKAFRNLYLWCQYGKAKPNFIGVLAVQWGGNQQDDWVPDYAVAAEYGWSPDRPAYDFDECLDRVRTALNRLRDYRQPAPKEVDRGAWDGIWLDEKGWWAKDIMGLALPLPLPEEK